MATRDRTGDFLSLRRTRQRRKDTDSGGLLDNSADTAKVAIRPVWVDRMTEVRGLEQRISKHMDELESMRKHHLKTEFNTQRNEDEEEAKISEAQTVIEALFKECEQQTKSMTAVFQHEVATSDADEQSAATDIVRIARNVQMRLVNEVQNLNRVYRENQRRYLQVINKKLSLVRKSTQSETHLMDNARYDQLLTSGMSQDAIESIMLNERLAHERVTEIDTILNSIEQLRDMFKDLNDLVVMQGTVLDRIDANMNKVLFDVTKGKIEIDKAAEIQKAGTFKLCLCLLLVLVVGFLLALLIKLA